MGQRICLVVVALVFGSPGTESGIHPSRWAAYFVYRLYTLNHILLRVRMWRECFYHWFHLAGYFCAWQLNPPNCDCSGLHGEWEKDTMWRQSIIWWLMLGGHLANSPLQEVPLHSLLLVTFCVYRWMHRCHFTPIICMTLCINMPKHWIKLWQGVRMEQDEMSFATY